MIWLFKTSCPFIQASRDVTDGHPIAAQEIHHIELARGYGAQAPKCPSCANTLGWMASHAMLAIGIMTTADGARTIDVGLEIGVEPGPAPRIALVHVDADGDFLLPGEAKVADPIGQYAQVVFGEDRLTLGYWGRYGGSQSQVGMSLSLPPTHRTVPPATT